MLKIMLEKLKEGDLIDIISPASPVTFAEVAQIKEYLANLGFRSRYLMADEIAVANEANNKFPASSGKARYQQLKMAIDNPESKAIWCSCGGYGSSDLIEFLRQDQKVGQNKYFIGYSDITSLSCFLNQNWGWNTIYGPMLRQLSQNRLHQQSEDAILKMITSEKQAEFYNKFDLTPLNNKNEASGILVGGCVSVLAHELGTKNQIDWSNKVLLLEDIEEKGEKLDRIFTQFLQIMVENKPLPRAIIFGNFYQFIESDELIQNIHIAITKFTKNILRKNLDIALFKDQSGFIGHSDAILPLIMGKNISIENKILLQKN